MLQELVFLEVKPDWLFDPNTKFLSLSLLSWVKTQPNVA